MEAANRPWEDEDDGRAGPSLVLASRSPQRRAILEQLGVDCVVRSVAIDELDRGDAVEVARVNAARKATAVAAVDTADAIVLGVDTVVAIDGRVLPKPENDDQAWQWLQALSGRTHTVAGGLCVIRDGAAQVGSTTTLVHFRDLEATEIDRYVRSDEWRDRAGGYAIQGLGATLVRGIEGDYFNVVGLPVATLLDLLPELLSDFA